MKICLCILAGALLFTVSTLPAWADLAPGGVGRRMQFEAEIAKREAEGWSLGTIPVIIEFDETAKELRMLVPRKLLANLRASADQPTAYDASAFTWLNLRNISIGLALTFSLAIAGLRLVRSRGGSRAPYLILLLPALATAGIMSNALWADVPPPGPHAHIITPPEGPWPITRSGQILVEVVEKGDAIRFIINRKQLTEPGANRPQPAPNWEPSK